MVLTVVALVAGAKAIDIARTPTPARRVNEQAVVHEMKMRRLARANGRHRVHSRP